ncbi:hypothetical protein, partial [Streptomyces ossamyceticus]
MAHGDHRDAEDFCHGLERSQPFLQAHYLGLEEAPVAADPGVDLVLGDRAGAAGLLEQVNQRAEPLSMDHLQPRSPAARP